MHSSEESVVSRGKILVSPQKDQRFSRLFIFLTASAIPVTGCSYFLGFGFIFSTVLFLSFVLGAGIVSFFFSRSKFEKTKEQLVISQNSQNSGVTESVERPPTEVATTPQRSSQTFPKDSLEIDNSRQAFRYTPERVLPPFTKLQPHFSSNQVATIANARNIEAKKTDAPALEPIDFDLRTAIEEAVDRFVSLAKDKKVELTCMLSYDVPTPFRGDPGHLRQILMNLIENALTSTERGEVVVRVVLVHQTPTHATFRFSVTSPGNDIISFQSEPLCQPPLSTDSVLHSSEKRDSVLTNSKNLVEAMGGKLGIENSPGQSSTIWFAFTFEKQPPKALPAPPPRSTLQGVHVLIVGDVPSTLLDQLSGWEMTSHSAKDSFHALQMVNAATTGDRAYDVVLLVCQKLEPASLELASTIRTTPSSAITRLVFVSETGEKGDAQRVHQAGIEAYLTQPVSQSLLFDCLATVLSQPLKGLVSSAPLITRYTLAEARARNRLRVLVVNSNLADQKYAVKLLEELGYRADIAMNRQEAIEAHARIPYAAVLMACQIPQLDGVAASAQIRQLDCQEGIYTPIIGIIETGSIGKFDEHAQTTMDDVLAKPFDIDNLRMTLDRCIARAKAAAAKSSLTDLIPQSSAEFDLHEALARVDGDKELFNEMVQLFLEEYPKSLAKIREALSQQDSQSVAYAANALRGALGNFAAASAISVTLRLEQMGRQGDLSQAQEATTSLEDSLSRLRSALTSLNLQLAA